MCGITGLFSLEGLADYGSALQAANNIVAYRGPDGAGFALFEINDSNGYQTVSGTSLDSLEIGQKRLALGHRRLAIIDLSSAGLQPMSNSDKSIWITYNGEVYNYLELRAELQQLGYSFCSQSDTEVILRAYEAWGEACVNRFNGMWAFAIADLSRKKLFCSRDRFGIKPFHYYYDGQRFVFGSEIKQLLCFPFVPKQVNERAAYEFLAYAAVDYCAETFFTGIYKLLQGHNLTLDLRTGSLTTTCYYQPSLTLNKDITFSEATIEFRRLLTDSVRLRLRSDVEVGSCLSGGLDSSSIVCLMHHLLEQEGKRNIQRTFSSHFEAKEANELEYMKTVIQATGVQADFIYPTPEQLLDDLNCLVWHQEEPFGSTSIFAQWSVYKLVHQHKVKVMLDGQGADEQLAGYLGLVPYFFMELQANQRLYKLAWEQWRHARLQGKPWLPLVPGKTGDMLRRLLHFRAETPPPPGITWLNPNLTKRYESESYYLANQQLQPFGESAFLQNTLYQLTFLNNVQSLLKYEDRNSMAFSVEARVPFLDHRLVEFIFSLPSDFKIRNGYTKRVLRDGMANILPKKIRWRTGKLGFATPELRWQKNVLRSLITQALHDERLHSFVVPDQALTYLEHIEKYNILDFAPWRWTNLSLWMNTYELA